MTCATAGTLYQILKGYVPEVETQRQTGATSQGVTTQSVRDIQVAGSNLATPTKKTRVHFGHFSAIVPLIAEVNSTGTPWEPRHHDRCTRIRAHSRGGPGRGSPYCGTIFRCHCDWRRWWWNLRPKALSRSSRQARGQRPEGGTGYERIRSRAEEGPLSTGLVDRLTNCGQSHGWRFRRLLADGLQDVAGPGPPDNTLRAHRVSIVTPRAQLLCRWARTFPTIG